MVMISPADAKRRMMAAVTGVAGIEMVGLRDGLERTLATDLTALRTQPPFAASAMDGYAVRAADLDPYQKLTVIGVAAAGHPFTRHVGPYQAVRIFTGAPVPDGADTILIQEHATIIADDFILPTQTEAAGRYIRYLGLDFSTGDVLLTPGQVLDGRHLGLAASMGHVALPVRVKPKVAILSTGDELVMPGEALGDGQIVSSNAFALAALVTSAGGEPIDLGVVADDALATQGAIARACACADIVLTSGGASVGDHDYVQSALKETGFSIEFWRIALRPGKPLMLGIRGSKLCVGLPGNPVASVVCGLLFVQPLIRKLLGQTNPEREMRERAVLGLALPANDMREEYMRATLTRDGNGQLIATPFAQQDSSVQRILAQSDALLIRPAYAAAEQAGSPCEIIRL